MRNEKLSVRSITPKDFENIVDYFLNGDREFLTGMGVDIEKLPKRDYWLQLLQAEFLKPIHEKSFFYMIWEIDKAAIGHSNINKIIVNNEAYMHLHIWHSGVRQTGLGYQFMKLTLPYFFELFDLKTLYCEPYALNQGPNRLMEKLGFDFLERFDTVPGWINLHQPVNRWCLSYEKYKLMNF